MNGRDGLFWHARVHVDKWSPRQVRDAAAALLLLGEPTHAQLLHVHGAPDGTADWEGNLVTTAGLGAVTSLIIGGPQQALSGAATTRIGVGNGTGTAARTDTDLSASAGSANRWFQAVISVAQATTTLTNDTFQLVATFATGNGNFAWNEWGIDVSAPTVSSGSTVGTTLVNHATSANLGTKGSGAAWTATMSISLS